MSGGSFCILGPTQHPEKANASYAPPASYVGPPCEPTRVPDQGWAFPPRAMHFRSSTPIRPTSEGPIPVANRGIFVLLHILYR